MNSLKTTDIPGLGQVVSRPMTFGLIQHAESRLDDAPPDDRPRLFTDLVLASMVESPQLSEAQLASLPRDTKLALVELAIDGLDVHDEFNQSDAALPFEERLYAAHRAKWLKLAETMRASIATIADAYSPVLDQINRIAVAQRDAYQAKVAELTRPFSDTLGKLAAATLKIEIPTISQELILSAIDPFQRKLLQATASSSLADLVMAAIRPTLPEPVLSSALAATMLESHQVHSTGYPAVTYKAPRNVQELGAASAEAQRRRLVNAYDILCELEQSLRALIEESLFPLHGRSWWRIAVPDAVRQECEERKREKEVGQRPIYHPIYYAYIDDYKKIILRKDNWRDAFSPVFGNRTELEATFMWVGRARDPIAHSRPLGDDDFLMFMAGARWLQARIKATLPPSEWAAI